MTIVWYARPENGWEGVASLKIAGVPFVDRYFIDQAGAEEFLVRYQCNDSEIIRRLGITKTLGAARVLAGEYQVEQHLTREDDARATVKSAIQELERTFPEFSFKQHFSALAFRVSWLNGPGTSAVKYVADWFKFAGTPLQLDRRQPCPRCGYSMPCPEPTTDFACTVIGCGFNSREQPHA